MKNVIIIPIVNKEKVLVNVIGDKYEFYRTCYDEIQDYYTALYDFCDVKDIIIDDIHQSPEFDYEGVCMTIDCKIDDRVIEEEKYSKYILLDKNDIFNVLADEKITGLIDYVLFEKLYKNYLK